MSNNQSIATRYYYSEYERSLLITGAFVAVALGLFVGVSTIVTITGALGAVVGLVPMIVMALIATDLVRTSRRKF